MEAVILQCQINYQNVLKCCANLTKYTTKNGLINNSNDHDLESCYDFGIIVYSNNIQSKYWFSYNHETQMMTWVQVDDSNDVINSGNGGPNIIGLNWNIQENCDPDEPEPEPKIVIVLNWKEQ